MHCDFRCKQLFVRRCEIWLFYKIICNYIAVEGICDFYVTNNVRNIRKIVSLVPITGTGAPQSPVPSFVLTYSPGTHQVSLVFLKLSPTPVDTIFVRAADRTCRLDVFKEVHLVSTPVCLPRKCKEDSSSSWHKGPRASDMTRGGLGPKNVPGNMHRRSQKFVLGCLTTEAPRGCPPPQPTMGSGGVA